MGFFKKYKKIILSLVAVISVIFLGKIMYASTYVGKRTVLYPKEEYNISEIIANKIKGYQTPLTIKELKEKGLINKDTHIVSKTKTKVEWYQSQESKAALNDLKNEFDKMDSAYEEEKNKSYLEEYIRTRKEYLNADEGVLKDSYRDLLKLQREQNKFLNDWEKSQSDSLINN